jgi:peptidyl-prolyl cis-trans isomerase D
VVLRLLDHQVAKLKPLDEVRDEISGLLRQAMATEAVTKQGKEALEALRSGQSLAEVAKANNLELKSPSMVNRYDAKLDQALRTELFRMPRPVGDKPSLAGLNLANGDYALLALTKVEDGVLTDESRDISQALERDRGERDLALYVTALEQAAKIKFLKPQARPLD